MARKNKKFGRLLSRRGVPLAVSALVLTAGIVGTTALIRDDPTPAAVDSPSKNSIKKAAKTDKNNVYTQPNNPKNDTPPTTPTPPPSSDSKKSVEPIITSVKQDNYNITVKAYINGIFEDGGTCTAKFTKTGYTSVAGSSQGFENVSYTSCGPIRVARSSFPATGTWSLVVSYKSAKAEGSSDKQAVEVK